MKVNNWRHVKVYPVDNNIDRGSIEEYNQVLANTSVFDEVGEYHMIRHFKKLMQDSARQKKFSLLVKFEYLSLKDLNLMRNVYNYSVVFAKSNRYAELCFFRTLSMA